MRTKFKNIMWKRTIIGVTIATLSFFFTMAPAQAETYPVKMGSDNGQLIFVPEKLEIQPGDTVKWVMNKVPPHNVIFEGDRIPTSDKALAQQISHQKLLFKPGDSYQTTFSKDMPSGIYPYYCQPHRAAGMAGQIIVKD